MAAMMAAEALYTAAENTLEDSAFACFSLLQIPVSSAALTQENRLILSSAAAAVLKAYLFCSDSTLKSVNSRFDTRRLYNDCSIAMHNIAMTKTLPHNPLAFGSRAYFALDPPNQQFPAAFAFFARALQVARAADDEYAEAYVHWGLALTLLKQSAALERPVPWARVQQHAADANMQHSSWRGFRLALSQAAPPVQPLPALPAS
ncbi:hypothetical protein WJX72_003156 [[Myrmecia] bisecta]|uniref:Uncharacterized protein n=1 Tax=[Myrmecia] bisecta TaxID=41462 RepID=A0AAW1QPS1_9CHLO